MNQKFEYDEIIHEIPENGGAYVIFPWDIRKIFVRGRVKVHATFDGIPYDGSIVNMGLKHSDGEICYMIGGTEIYPETAWKRRRRLHSCGYRRTTLTAKAQKYGGITILLVNAAGLSPSQTPVVQPFTESSVFFPYASNIFRNLSSPRRK